MTSTVLIIAKDLAFPSGGPVYASRIVRAAIDAGLNLQIWTARSAERQFDGGSITWHESPSYFRHGQTIAQKLERRREEHRLVALTRTLAPNWCLILGDTPRAVHRRISRNGTRVACFLHDVSHTCPGDPGLRSLGKSCRICTAAPGLSCLRTHRVEGCMGSWPLMRQVQRVARTRLALNVLASLDSVIANSRYVAEQYRRCHDGIRATILEPCVGDAVEIRDDPDPEDRFSVGYVGRVEIGKGALEAVEILRLLPPSYRLKIIGSGDAEGEVARRGAELGVADRIEMCGWLAGEALAREVAGCGVVVVPSLVAEAFGMAGPEALVLGTPVVAYQSGGIVDWCDGDCARATAIGDRAGAAKAIQDVTSDASRWMALRERARNCAAERFSKDRWRRQLARILGVEALTPEATAAPMQKLVPAHA